MNALDVTDSPERAARDSQHGLVIWRFRYQNKLTGELKNGMVTLEPYRKPDSKIAAVYGDIMDWERGVDELKSEPYNDALCNVPPQTEKL